MPVLKRAPHIIAESGIQPSVFRLHALNRLVKRKLQTAEARFGNPPRKLRRSGRTIVMSANADSHVVFLPFYLSYGPCGHLALTLRIRTQKLFQFLHAVRAAKVARKHRCLHADARLSRIISPDFIDQRTQITAKQPPKLQRFAHVRGHFPRFTGVAQARVLADFAAQQPVLV